MCCIHKMEDIMNRQVGFTLAEILITLGIIGVVAALTMPSLITKHQEKQTEVKLKKVYSTLSNAMMQAVQENGPFQDWGIGKSVIDINQNKDEVENSNKSRDKLIDIFSKYLKTVSVCKYSESNCEIYNPKNLAGKVDNYDSYSNRIVLADGTYFGHLYTNSSTCEDICGTIKVDLNGTKKPNTYGRDIFEFIITPTSIIPAGTMIAGTMTYPTHTFETTCVNPDPSSSGAARLNGIGCTAWVIYNGNMDYLHCPEELGWDKKLKCD